MRALRSPLVNATAHRSARSASSPGLLRNVGHCAQLTGVRSASTSSDRRERDMLSCKEKPSCYECALLLLGARLLLARTAPQAGRIPVRLCQIARSRNTDPGFFRRTTYADR